MLAIPPNPCEWPLGTNVLVRSPRPSAIPHLTEPIGARAGGHGVESSDPKATRAATTAGGLTRRLLAGSTLAILAFGLVHWLMTALLLADGLAAITAASATALAVAAITLIRTIAPLVATQADLQVRYEAALADALRDPLTRLGNHRAFHEELDRQVSAAQRYQV